MSIVMYQTLSSVCVGEGSVAGAVDLPVSREKHTRWPYFPSSGIKGALRATEQDLDEEILEKVYGTGSKRGDLIIGPATLLLLPTRTLKGSYVFLTCPLALDLLFRSLEQSIEIPKVDIDIALGQEKLCKEISLPIGDNTLDSDISGVAYLEDLDWQVRKEKKLQPIAKLLEQWVGEKSSMERILLVSDDVFIHAVSTWLPVRTRTSIGANGVVKDGQLFTSEALPPETVLWGEVDGVEHFDKEGFQFRIGRNQTIGQGNVVMLQREERCDEI